MKIKSIQIKLLMILVPLFLVFLGLLSLSSYYFSKQSLTASVNETAMAVGTDYANRVQDDIEVLLARLDGVANHPALRIGSDKAQIMQVLQEVKQANNGFDALIFIAPDGMGVTSEGTMANYGDRDYFKQAVSTKKAVVSNPLLSKSTGKLSVMLAVPVMNNGQMTGVTIGTVSLERLTNMIGDLKFLETGYGQISDASGMIIAHPKQPELVGKLNLIDKKINSELNLQQTELDDQLIQLIKTSQTGKQVKGNYTFVDGIARVAVATPINLPGGQRWVMMVAAPQQEATRATSHLAWLMLGISLVCLLLAAGSIVILAKRFAAPITRLRDECLLLAQGDLRERKMHITSVDEIGQLAQGFRAMQRNLRDLVAKMSAQSEHLAASSEELTASSDQSSQAVNQVAASITEVAAGASEQLVVANETASVVEKMTAHIQHVAATSSQVADRSEQAADKAGQGSESVNEAVNQMAQIEETVNTSAKVVAELGEKSKEIGQIVATISGIAGQTNLLALNAAIEAARAGEQGKGFAVVAEEVRKLAEQSQAATEQISSLIGGIQGETDKAVASMDAGTREVKRGAEVVNFAGQAFQEIVTLVAQVSEQVKENSAAINELATASEKIVKTVEKIDRLSKKAAGEAQTVSAATEEQSAAMEEIASSSQSLANLAIELQEAIRKFSI
ncbi:methyl-accepting chemotaxis protein [Sporomusaceae bacterium BoRhaA]|uniref:methyl-accepting chemotaxis protein n=1 Tax=Pelorhabdus rhamnosifermentans TaxID=2772457 RepID=UPI001C06006A|nr:methyl-accepting chemotaxis protein [Pelorhabdus rhamnosifermentans]MBU2703079.1 methyl-accepting chemotaxis protein [Pelorhabdus rhamnosifermentans]